MEVKKILDYLNHYFKTKSYQTLADDPSIGGPELNKLEYCSYFAILNSFSKEELKEADKIIKDGDYCHVLRHIVEQTLNPIAYNVFEKNDSIDVLIKRFSDRTSRRVVESRKKLISRFPYLSYAEQKKVVKAFLSSNSAADIEWAAVEADRRWDKSYEPYVIQAFGLKELKKLAFLIMRHMPIDYVKSNEASLVVHSRVEFCIRMAKESDNLARKYGLNIFEYVYLKARTGTMPQMSGIDLEEYFFGHILDFAQNTLRGQYEDQIYLSRMPWLRRALWSLGKLGYADILLKFLNLNRYVEDKHLECSDKTEYYYSQQWIIDRYFPEAMIIEPIEESPSPLDEYDDLPPDDVWMSSDFE